MTNAELAVLSLLSEAPGYGYDLEAKIEARGMREWTEIGFSSIYAILKKLERAGLVEVEQARSVGQGAPRKVYRITATGREAQQEATLEALSTPGRPNASLLLGLSNLPILPKDQALEALGQYRAALEDSIEQLLNRAQAQQPLPDFVEAMFDYSTTMIATELAWLNEYMQNMEDQNG
jgi:DNA-binding PadR family transcriptional regulator